MFQNVLGVAVVAVAGVIFSSTLSANEISGVYLETRTCQVYTGPCFANGEMGLAGKDAIMAWSIERGQSNGVRLDGLNVVVVLKASQTLGFRGIDSADDVKSIILVDQRANDKQRRALIEFAKHHSGRAGQSVVRVDSTAIEMSLDIGGLTGSLQADKGVTLTTRQARPEDCICSNEVAFYPPLAKVDNFVAGVTVEGKFSGRGLGTTWSTPQARSSYMATFNY